MRGSHSHRVVVLLLLLVVGTGIGFAGERDLAAARSAFLTAAGGSDDAKLAAAAARLARTDPPRGALSLVDLGLERGERRSALIARNELTRTTDGRTCRALAARLGELRASRARRLLCEALGGLPGEEVTRALVHALSDEDFTVRAAGAGALGARDATAAAIASISLHELARRDPSGRVRLAANAALSSLGLQPLPGLDVSYESGGFPSRFLGSRVAFLLDASGAARDPVYTDPMAPVSSRSSGPAPAREHRAPTHRGGKTPSPPVSKERPPISCLDLETDLVVHALARLGASTAFRVARFSSTVSACDKGFMPGRGAEVARATAWLERSPGSVDDDRDVVRALRDEVTQDSPPDEIYLLLSGMPEGRESESAEAAYELAVRAWERGILVHVTLFALEPGANTASAREALERERADKGLHEFAQRLAATTGGRLTVVPLPRHAITGAQATKPGTTVSTSGEGTAPVVSAVRLANGRVPYSELSALRHALDLALKGERTVYPAEELVRELAGCPDDGTAELGVRALLDGSVPLKLAALDGFAANRDARAHAKLAELLRSQTDPTKAALIARGLAAMPGADVTRALAAEAEARPGSGDLARVLLSELARRPSDELAPIASQVSRALRPERQGLASSWARRALESALGKPWSPSDPEAGRLLPEKLAPGAGIALLIDGDDRELDAEFARRAPVPPAKAPELVTRRDVVVGEVARVLGAVRAAHGRVNVLVLGDGGTAWRDQASPLTPASEAEAVSFLRGRLHSGNREVRIPLERVLADPTVDEVWVLPLGLPNRSDADEDVDAMRRRLRQIWLERAVTVHVVIPIGTPAPSDDPAATRAEERDRLHELLGYWNPIAELTGGEVTLRSSVSLPEKGASDVPTRRER